MRRSSRESCIASRVVSRVQNPSSTLSKELRIQFCKRTLGVRNELNKFSC
jgi:hypothetical protein